MCRRLGERDRVASSDIYRLWHSMGWRSFSRDRSRVGNTREFVKIAMDSLVEIELIQPNGNVTRSRRGLSLLKISRTQNPPTYVEYSNISYVETRSFGTLNNSIEKQYHPLCTNRCRKIHRNNAIRMTDVRAKSRTDWQKTRSDVEATAPKIPGGSREHLFARILKTPPRKSPKFRRGRRNAWRRADAW